MNITNNLFFSMPSIEKFVKIFVLIFVLFQMEVLAQSNLTTPVMLPEAGDVFHYEVEKSPALLNWEGGTNKRWDFSSLLSPVTQKVNWQAAGAVLKVQIEEK